MTYSYIKNGKEFTVKEATAKDICLIAFNNITPLRVFRRLSGSQLENPIFHFLEEGVYSGIFENIVYTSQQIKSKKDKGMEYVFYGIQ